MKKCKNCGAEFDETLRDLESDLCFSCYFWEEQYQTDQEYRKIPEHFSEVIIIDGHHYVADTDPSHKKNLYKGIGGAPHLVKFKDGRVEAFDNLWHQGEIPEIFREKLPDNAEFISIGDYQLDLLKNKNR